MEGNVTVQVMSDGGKDFFKVSMTILPENYSKNLNAETDEESEFEISYVDNEKGKRSKYSEGGQLERKQSVQVLSE